MLRLTREGESFLYTGDFKLRPGRSAETCAPPRADVVVMETTFGLPRYVFPPTEEVLAAIIRFCRQALEDGEVPVLFGYSLGKSQELLSSLADGEAAGHAASADAEDDAHLRGAGADRFRAYRPFTLTEVAGHVVVCPPQANQSAWLRKIKPRRTAAITGWAIDPAAIYRYQCDAAFPLSDHADYADLLRFVELVQPKRVFTVHGFVEEFARTLRERGVEAWALGVDNQLEISLTELNRAAAGNRRRRTKRAREAEQRAARTRLPERAGDDDSTERPARLRATWRKKSARRPRSWRRSTLLKTYFAALQARGTWPAAAVAFTGRPFPPSDSAHAELRLGHHQGARCWPSRA